jgi:hypothetical protein
VLREHLTASELTAFRASGVGLLSVTVLGTRPEACCAGGCLPGEVGSDRRDCANEHIVQASGWGILAPEVRAQPAVASVSRGQAACAAGAKSRCYARVGRSLMDRS